jgi:hypothetical protein
MTGTPRGEVSPFLFRDCRLGRGQHLIQAVEDDVVRRSLTISRRTPGGRTLLVVVRQLAGPQCKAGSWEIIAATELRGDPFGMRIAIRHRMRD